MSVSGQAGSPRPTPGRAPAVCDQCGMLLDDAGEFHPYVFCLLKKAHRDPWQELTWIVERLGGSLPEKPPLVRDLPHRPAIRLLETAVTEEPPHAS
jgi:hypothetical protein